MTDEPSKRPLFQFGDDTDLPQEDGSMQRTPPQGQLALTGPSPRASNGPLPVRGDLAHIRLAGRYFVPHYAVPMPHKVGHLIWLRAAADLSSDEICELPVGSTFNVLDIAGGWAWGQSEEDGPVGYVPMSNLEASAP